MKHLLLGIILVGFVFSCTFPEQYKGTSEITLDEQQAKLLTMPEEEFIQQAKQDDPAFRKELEQLNVSHAASEKIKSDQDDRDQELKLLVESETAKKKSQIQSLQDEITEESLENSGEATYSEETAP